LDDIKTKACNSEGEPTIINETVATAYVDGNNLLGPVIGKFCMNLAIKKAKEAGIGWVVAKGIIRYSKIQLLISTFYKLKGSNHFGIAGFYTLLALEQNLLVSSLIFFLILKFFE